MFAVLHIFVGFFEAPPSFVRLIGSQGVRGGSFLIVLLLSGVGCTHPYGWILCWFGSEGLQGVCAIRAIKAPNSAGKVNN